MAKILIVDDDARIQHVLSILLKTYDHETITCSDPVKALELLKVTKVDLILSDIRMDRMNGLEFLRAVRAAFPELPVIMLTGFASVATATEVLALGGFDYVTKPIKIDDLISTVQRALDSTSADLTASERGLQSERLFGFTNVVAVSPSMRAVCAQVEKLGSSNTPVLICGEKGTGKKLLARAIHENGPRRQNPMIEINCAEVPETILEAQLFGSAGSMLDGSNVFKAAQTGSLLLDEIDILPVEMQRHLLKVIREKRLPGNNDFLVDVQLFVLSNANLESMVNDGLLLRELFAFLSVFRLDIKPLRERPEDIVPLVIHFMHQNMPALSNMPAIGSEVREILLQYEWPGNVADLENVIKYAATRIRNDRMTSDDLPEKLATGIKVPRPDAATASFMKSEYWAKSLKAYLHNYLSRK